MDADTMTRKGAHKKTLDAFRSGRIDILIGTQMIAKGLHFPNVTLVGIIFADLSLHIPDFRAGERTFQLLTQVAGRAGRGVSPGRVVVQSYTPFHPALNYALDHDFDGFVEEELPAREALAFPPATHMAIIHFRGESQVRTLQFAERFGDKLRRCLSDDVQAGSPAPAPVEKIRGKYRYQILLRGGPITQLTRLLRHMVLKTNPPKGVVLYVDIDPYSLM